MKKKKRELSRKEMGRQDLVDNAIFRLINELRPDGVSEMEWDINKISEIREAVQSVVCDTFEMTEKEFYPYLD